MKGQMTMVKLSIVYELSLAKCHNQNIIVKLTFGV